MDSTIVYQICESTGEFGTGWGIEALECVARADDISPDRESVKGLCRLMNENKLELIHMFDVIMDFLP